MARPGARVTAAMLAGWVALGAAVPGATVLAASKTGGNNSSLAEQVLSAASTVEAELLAVKPAWTRARQAHTVAVNALGVVETDVSAQRTASDAVTSDPQSSPPSCAQVRKITADLSVEHTAYSTTQLALATFSEDDTAFQDALSTLGSAVLTLAADVSNLVAAIADAKGHKIPKIPVKLAGKDGVKALIQVIHAFLKAMNLIPNSLANRAAALQQQAQALNLSAQNAADAANLKPCTGP
jgi:hypothetical protein